MASEMGLGGRGSGVERYGAMLRDLMDRVRKLESRRVMSTGDWVISQDPAGNLIATNTVTSAVVILAVP